MHKAAGTDIIINYPYIVTHKIPDPFHFSKHLLKKVVNIDVILYEL